jgi:hypothetical protein
VSPNAYGSVLKTVLDTADIVRDRDFSPIGVKAYTDPRNSHRNLRRATPLTFPLSFSSCRALQRSTPSTRCTTQTFGFLVLRHFFDPRLIAAEIDQVMRNGPQASFEVTRGKEIHFQYVPMMTAETPGSLWLLDRTETVASTLFGGPVLPTRAKGTRYWGDTSWHTDSDLPIPSLGVVTYSACLREKSGALRLLPGSHCSYGSDWRNSGRPCVKRLEVLGVYELAAKQEAFAGSRR